MEQNRNSLRIKLVVTDLDGTFLNDSRMITGRNLDAVRELARNNIAFSFCTGRPVAMTKAFIKQADIRIPVIGCNGALIYDPENNSTLFSRVFPAELFSVLTEYCLSCGFDYLAYTADTVYYSAGSRRIDVFRKYNQHAQRAGCIPAVLKLTGSADSILHEKVTKILVTELHGTDLEKMAAFLSGIRGVVCAPSMTGVLDIMPEGVSKGSGVRCLADHLGIHMDNVCVFGDNTNDVSMMQCAGTPVCMANGTEDARKAASFVTGKTNNESGFAEWIFRYLCDPDAPLTRSL
jgi:Cof subfamily protein (haloacid dehalogenase superfamily)